MQAALKRDWVEVDDYLAAEEASSIKHEYLAGTVYAMAGATPEHNQIALNIAAALRSHLKGKPCRVFISDVKLRMKIAGEDVIYYPDVMVGCDPRDRGQKYLRYPKVLVEVASDSTERLDRGEKRRSYQTIETLEEYIIVAQDRPEATIFRRANQWEPEVRAGFSQEVSLASLSLCLPLALVYDEVLEA